MRFVILAILKCEFSDIKHIHNLVALTTVHIQKFFTIPFGNSVPVK